MMQTCKRPRVLNSNCSLHYVLKIPLIWGLGTIKQLWATEKSTVVGQRKGSGIGDYLAYVEWVNRWVGGVQCKQCV